MCIRDRVTGSAFSNSFSLPGTNSTHALQLLESGFPAKSGDADQIVFSVKSGPLKNHEAAINKELATIAKLPEVCLLYTSSSP